MRPRCRPAALSAVTALLLAVVVVSTTADRADAATFTGTVDASGVSWIAHDFAVTEPGTLTAVLDWTDASADLSLILKDPLGTVVAASAAPDRKPERIVYEASATGTYKLGVKAVSGATAYTLDADIDTGATRYEGHVDASGTYWVAHAFAADTPGRLSATLDWDSTSANLNLFLKDPSGTIVASAASPSSKPERLVHDVVTAGTYKLGVRAVSGAANYTLDVVLNAADEPTDGYTGHVDASGTLWQSHAYTAPGPGTLTGVLDWTDPDADLQLSLKDPSGAEVAAARTTAKPEQLSYEVPSAGTYRFGIKAVRGATDYVLSAQFSAPEETGDEWPMFMHDARNSGVSAETALGSSNAPSLELLWQANTGDATFASPSIVWSRDLGRHVVYTGNQLGMLSAYDATTGDRIWAHDVAGNVASSPSIVDGVIYYGATDRHLYALDADTGALRCRYDASGIIYTSPLVTTVDGIGTVVYFGDSGITGGDDGGAFHAIHGVDPNAAANCSRIWDFDAWGAPPGSVPSAGSYSPPVIETDARGRRLVVVGSSSPDQGVYAFDAVTGDVVWRFQCEFHHPDEDVSAGPTVSPPGVNGLSGGAVYVANKARIMYAIDLTTGGRLWEFRVRDDSKGLTGSTRSTAALVEDRLLFGYGAGVYALDARTGGKFWKSQDLGAEIGEVVSSPAISGAAGDRVLFVGDMAGKVYAIEVATGATRWSYQTGGFVYGSAAVAAGRMFIGSADGYLYAFGIPDRPSAPPDTTIDDPADGAELAHPGRDLAIAGRASDDRDVRQVRVALKDTNRNRWWDPVSLSWKAYFVDWVAEGTTSWRTAFPVPFSGGGYFVQAEAIDDDGQHDPNVARASFTIASAGDPPDTIITAPTHSQVFHFPDGVREPFPITVEGSATDSGGTTPGIATVKVSIRNIEHDEYYCGSSCSGSGSPEAAHWTTTPTWVNATLTSPGAVSSGWTLTFPVYDHPHKYRITAYAIDRDGETDATPALVGRICIRDPGDDSCV